MTKLNTQLESESKKASSAQLENCKFREKIAEQQAQLESTANLNRDMSQRINLLEEEILSLKVHAGASEDTRPMMTKKNQNTPPQNQNTQNLKFEHPHVIMIGTSNTTGVDTKRLSTKFTSEKHIAYTISDTDGVIEKIDKAPQAFVLHTLTNELKKDSAEECIKSLETLICNMQQKFPSSKIIVSLPTPRSDDKFTNIKAQLACLSFKEKLKKMKDVFYCDNSNLGYNGNPNFRYFRNDMVHLNNSGISIFASNLRHSINRTLNIPDHSYQSYQ